tara:strand:- start:362 stop:1288 length:927 start_codon:yes stop_codon:yes gene_type:complete
MSRNRFDSQSFGIDLNSASIGNIMMNRKNIIASILAVFIIILVFGGFYTIDERERGVVTRYGKVVDTPQPGLGFKFPIVDKVHKIPVQDYSEVYTDLQTYSKDQQPATLTVSVTYRLDQSNVLEIFTTYSTRQGVLDRLVTRKLMEEVKTVFGQYTAVSAIQDRGRLNSDIANAIQKSVEGPVIILGVQVEDVSFSDAYEKSIEDRMLAEVAVQKEIQNGAREKELKKIKITQAEATSESTILNANAEAEAIRVKGEAEAAAIRARTEALKDNAKLIELVKAEKWNGVLPVTMLPNQTIPFIDMNKKQ